jgi:hypothetical protein
MKLAALILVLLILATLTGCAPGPNNLQGTPADKNAVAGFWLGAWQGLIAPFVLVPSLFKSGLNIYEVHNNGAWYNFGYIFGLACFFGGSGNRARRRS